ncbi:ABC transporter permease [Demequina sediminicola]|uniref:ABC transporter permease n=1 Tax=Demequina sediminicola TaxID=1095026 RepID=UPI0007811B01|nr:ABC transporter permease subunit [Demequina sediminicola]
MSASDVSATVDTTAQAVQARSRAPWWKTAGPIVITGIVLLVLWAVFAIFADALPGPADTAAELGRMTADGELWSIFGRITLFMGTCFAIAAVGGVALGLLLGSNSFLDRGLSPYLAALQGMPTSMWIPVAAVLLGTSPWSLAAVVSIGAMPAIMLGTRSAVKNVPPLLVRAGRTFGADRGTLLRHVVLPAALPGIFTGLELGWSIAFRCLVAGEIFSGALSGTGIGDVIDRSRATGDLTEMMATIMIVLTFTLLVDRLVFAKVQHKLRVSRGLVDTGLPH